MKDSFDSSPGGRRPAPRKRISSTSSSTDKRDRRPSAAGTFSGAGRPPFWNKPNDPGFEKRKEGGDGKPDRGGRSGGFKPRSDGDRPARPFSDRKPPFRQGAGGPDRREGSSSEGRSGGFDARRSTDRPAYGDKKPFSGDRKFGDRPKPFDRNSGGDRPERKPFNDRGDGNAGDRPLRKPFGDREQKSFGDRPRFASAGSDRKPYSDRPESRSGDRPERKTFGDGPKRPFTPGSDRKPFSDRPEGRSGDRPERKSFGDGPSRPFTSGADRKPYGDRPERKPFGDRDQKSFGDRPARPFSGGPDRKPFGDKDRGAYGKPKGDFASRPPRTDRDDNSRGNDREKMALDKSTRLGKQAPSQVRNFRRSGDGPARGETPDYNWKRIDHSGPRVRGKFVKESEGDNKDGSLMRLNRFIAHAGLCSRREADELISTGQITVNGKMIDQMGYMVKLDDVVKYGKRLLNKEKLVYLLLNKPKDFITTTEDPDERKTVMGLVATACKERIYPVGRLDRNTTGLLLLTNDGELSEKLMHPSHNIKKIYQVDLDKPLTAAHEKQIREGLELEDGKAPVDELEVLSKEKDIVGISIHLGRNRIVRRIFESLDYEVLRLDRVMYAGLTKKDLPRGNWRFLTEKEVINLKYFS